MAGAGALSALAGYSTVRGLRYPTVSFTPRPLATDIDFDSFSASVHDLIHVQDGSEVTKFRAYTPQPKLELQATKNGIIRFNINNISQLSKISVTTKDASSDKVKVEETQISAIERQVTLSAEQGDHILLEWQFPELDEVQFGVIGDTGGCAELAWSMLRAKELGCQFLLHLGDFNYTPGDYDNAVKLFHRAALPTYITIGNHDFHDDGLIYSTFREQLGTLNNAFVVNNTRFINLDTAADFFPASTGLRGEFVEQLRLDTNKYDDSIVFTHRPLLGPDEDADRTPGGINEVAWIAKMMREINSKTLLAGHVHRSVKLNYEDIKQFIVGDGLAIKESITLGHHSKLLVGKVRRGELVQYQWQPLAIPFEYLVSPRHLEELHKHSTPEHTQKYLATVSQAALANPFEFSQSLL